MKFTDDVTRNGSNGQGKMVGKSRAGKEKVKSDVYKKDIDTVQSAIQKMGEKFMPGVNVNYFIAMYRHGLVGLEAALYYLIGAHGTECWSATKTLANELGCTHGSARNAISDLREKGFVITTPPDRLRNGRATATHRIVPLDEVVPVRPSRR